MPRCCRKACLVGLRDTERDGGWLASEEKKEWRGIKARVAAYLSVPTTEVEWKGQTLGGVVLQQVVYKKVERVGVEGRQDAMRGR